MHYARVVGKKSATSWAVRSFWAVATAGIAYVLLVVSLPDAAAAVHYGGAGAAGVLGAAVGPAVLELMGSL